MTASVAALKQRKKQLGVEDKRALEDLISVGPAIRRDFELLGIHTVAQLARQEPKALYDRLCRKTGQRQDPCVLDVFCAAVAQARDPRLPLERCRWWYWSAVRKANGKSRAK
jgi:Pathogenicity locus